MLVRISEEGMRISQNKKLAEKVIKAIMNSTDILAEGKSVPVEGSNISIQMVTATGEIQKSENARR